MIAKYILFNTGNFILEKKIHLSLIVSVGSKGLLQTLAPLTAAAIKTLGDHVFCLEKSLPLAAMHSPGSYSFSRLFCSPDVFAVSSLYFLP